jgi:hypothetical protein
VIAVVDARSLSTRDAREVIEELGTGAPHGRDGSEREAGVVLPSVASLGADGRTAAVRRTGGCRRTAAALFL